MVDDIAGHDERHLPNPIGDAGDHDAAVAGPGKHHGVEIVTARCSERSSDGVALTAPVHFSAEEDLDGHGFSFVDITGVRDSCSGAGDGVRPDRQEGSSCRSR